MWSQVYIDILWMERAVQALRDGITRRKKTNKQKHKKNKKKGAGGEGEKGVLLTRVCMAFSAGGVHAISGEGRMRLFYPVLS